MNKPYKYCPETDIVSNEFYTLHVMEEVPEWEGQDLIEDVHFTVDLHPDNHNIGIALPIRPKFKVGEIVYFRTGTKEDPKFPEKLFTNKGRGYLITAVTQIEKDNPIAHLTAIGETTKPPRKYKIENFRLIKTVHPVKVTVHPELP